MNKLILDSFCDEMEKIAEVSLSGVSPKVSVESSGREPLVTEGYNKASAILSKAQKMKTAGKKKEQYSEGRKYLKPTFNGAAAGAILGSLTSHKAPNQIHRLIGAGTGASIGLTDAIIRHKKEVANGKK